jgi:hypothetical protein
LAAPTVLQSVSKIQFDDTSSTLFVADWKQAKIFAFTLPPISNNPPAEGSPFGLNIEDLERKLRGDHPNKKDILFEDLAVRPNTYDVYTAVTMKQGDEEFPLIASFRVDEENLELEGGSYTPLDLANMEYTVADINDFPAKDQLWFNKANDPVESYVVTDMNFYKGKLYASGLASFDAASVMRIYDFPFTGAYKTKR